MARQRIAPGSHGNITYTALRKRPGGKPERLARVGNTYRDREGRTVKPDAWLASTNVRDKDGRKRQVARQGDRKEQALATLLAALADRHAPTTADIRATTLVVDLADLWRSHVERAGQVSTETLKLYRLTLDRHIKPGVLAELQVREVNAGTVHDFLAGLINRETGKGRGSAKTARTVLRGMFELAVRNDAIKVNPVRQADRVQAPTKAVRRIEKEKKGHLTASEIDAVLGMAASPDWRHRDLADLLHFLNGTGARIGEALALTWERVNLDAGTVEIGGHTVVRVKGEGLRVEEHGSTKSFDRTLTLPTSLASRLLERRVSQGDNPLELVFPTPAYGLRGGTTLRDVPNTTKEIRKVFEAAGVTLPKGQGSHLFRHTVGTILLQKGVPIRDVSNQLGHVATKTTTDLYASRKTVARAAADHL